MYNVDVTLGSVSFFAPPLPLIYYSYYPTYNPGGISATAAIRGHIQTGQLGLTADH